MEQQRLNPTIVYVLSIIGLLCCCIGGSGALLAGPAFFIAQSGLNKAKLNPEEYDQSSVKNMNTAKIIALVILVINIIMIIRVVYVIATVGWDEMTSEFMKAYEEGMKAQQQGQ